MFSRGPALDCQPEFRVVVPATNIRSLRSKSPCAVKKAQSFAEILFVEANVTQAGNGVYIVGRLAENLVEACSRCLSVLAAKRLESPLFIGISNLLLLLRPKANRD